MENLLKAVEELTGEDLKKDGSPTKGALKALLELHESEATIDELQAEVDKIEFEPKESEGKVTNLYTSPININGVEIKPKESAELELDLEHSVIKAWIAKKVIKLG